MDYELISAEDFDKLPEDNEQCFVEFEAICRRNMTEMMEEDNRSGDFYTSMRAHYMAAVYSVAQQCGIPNTPIPTYRSNGKSGNSTADSPSRCRVKWPASES